MTAESNINSSMISQLNILFPDTKNTFADFFSGAGGFSLGFIQAGMKCVSAMDFDFDAVRTYWTNLCLRGWSHLWILEKDMQTYKKLQKWSGKTDNWLFEEVPTDNWLQQKRRPRA